MRGVNVPWHSIGMENKVRRWIAKSQHSRIINIRIKSFHGAWSWIPLCELQHASAGGFSAKKDPPNNEECCIGPAAASGRSRDQPAASERTWEAVSGWQPRALLLVLRWAESEEGRDWVPGADMRGFTEQRHAGWPPLRLASRRQFDAQRWGLINDHSAYWRTERR